MTDETGRLTQEELSRVIAWMKKMEAGRPNAGLCPVCNSERWFIAENLVQPITLGKGRGLILGGESNYPCVMLISDPCGYTRLINAVLVGLVPGEVPKPKEGA